MADPLPTPVDTQVDARSDEEDGGEARAEPPQPQAQAQGPGPQNPPASVSTPAIATGRSTLPRGRLTLDEGVDLPRRTEDLGQARGEEDEREDLQRSREDLAQARAELDETEDYPRSREALFQAREEILQQLGIIRRPCFSPEDCILCLKAKATVLFFPCCDMVCCDPCSLKSPCAKSGICPYCGLKIRSERNLDED